MTDDQKRKPAKDDSQGAPSLEADRHRAVIETSADGFLTVDFQGRIFEVNEAYVRRSGYSRSELLSMHIRQLEAKEDPTETAEHIRKLLREGSELFETLHRAKDGTVWQAEVNASFWPGDGGRFFNFVRDVTQRKRAEDALRESEEKFRTIFGQLQDGILIADAETLSFVETNATMCALLGYTREELLRLGMKDLHREADLPLARQAFARQLEGSLPLVTDIPMLRKDGSVFLADVNAAVIRLGERACLAGIFRDVTQRRRDERALAESEANYRALFEFSTDGIFLLDLEGNFVDANRTAYERLGYTREEFLGMSIRQLDDPAFAVRVPERMSQIRERGVAIFESGHRRKDGTTMPVEVNSRLLEYGGRTILFSQIRDLTERKLAQEKEDRLLKAISVATEGIAITDRQDRFLYVNDAHARLYGRRPEELLGKTWRETVPPALVPAIEPELARALHRKTVGVWSGEAPGLRKDGSQFPMEVMATSRWDEAGDYLGHICIVRDITERKRTEELLRESERKYRAIVETTSDWIWSCDTRGVHTYSNGAVRSILGREPAEIVGRSTEELLHPDDAAAAGAIVRQALASRSGWQGVQLRWRHGDGSYRTLESTATPTLDASGALLGWLGMDRDVTERKLLEEERLKTQKLESIGTLAGGIAHDFNNLLQGVFGYISMAKMPLDRGDRTYAMLDQAEKALHLSVNLTNQLLTFSKGGRPVKKRVALGPVIANAARFALSGSRSVCRLEIDPGLWEADADEGQIAQVIQNVALNADQAMPLGGTVTVTARNLPAAEAVAHPGLGSREHVEIAVRDEGVGIPAQYLDRIFDPYFTTKEKGSGLGLATSYSIVKNHEGKIEVKSTPGAGSTFTIYLPAVAAVAAAAAGPEVLAGTRTGRILVMDDEEIVRTIAGELLASLGHEVVLAERGETALDKFRAAREAGRPFDVVILDLTIRGGMGGAETMRKLLEIDAGVKAVVSSGYSDDDVTSSFREHGFRAFLKKPYRLEELKGALNALLE